MNLKTMSDNQLMNEFRSLNYSVHTNECYKSKDVTNLVDVENELSSRGFELVQEPTFYNPSNINE